MTAASRKAKGRRLQKEIAERIAKVLDMIVERDGEIDVRPMGQGGRDVILRGKALEQFIFHGIECKNTEALNIWAALAQAETHGGKPIVFFKRNRSETYVAMKADDFFELYEIALKELEKCLKKKK